MSMQAGATRQSMKPLFFLDPSIRKRVLFGVAVVAVPMLLMASMLAVSLLSLQANIERLVGATAAQEQILAISTDLQSATQRFLVLGALVLLSVATAALLIARSVCAAADVPARNTEKSALEPVVTDNSPCHRAEMESRQQRDPLEEAVAKRTSELSAAVERSDAANRAKSAFLATVSHELRTPLSAVLGYAELLMSDGSLSARQVLGLDTIRHSGEHLLLLTNDILDLAKVEAGKLDLVPSVVQMDDFLRVLGDIVRIKTDQKGISFAIDCMPGLPRAVSVDKKRLRQVLLNLLANAVRFTERGHVTLIVRHTPRDNTTVRLNFAVQDTGIGIEPDQLARIFEPFEQVGEPRRRIDGAGLGLTISRQLVRLMHGEISVESRPGEGSCFCFELSVPVVDTCDQSTRQEVAST